jgi:HSP20 family molecular chaperone IbpA
VNYDYHNRGYLLPPGCKDLIDAMNYVEDIVLVQVGEHENKFIIEFKLSGLQRGNIEIVVEGRHVRVGQHPHESVIEVPPGYEITRAKAACFKSILRIFIPKC